MSKRGLSFFKTSADTSRQPVARRSFRSPCQLWGNTRRIVSYTEDLAFFCAFKCPPAARALILCDVSWRPNFKLPGLCSALVFSTDSLHASVTTLKYAFFLNSRIAALAGSTGGTHSVWQSLRTTGVTSILHEPNAMAKAMLGQTGQRNTVDWPNRTPGSSCIHRPAFIDFVKENTLSLAARQRLKPGVPPPTMAQAALHALCSLTTDPCPQVSVAKCRLPVHATKN